MFKLLFFFALAYFIYRSARNLIVASMGAGRESRQFDRQAEGREKVDDRVHVDRPPTSHAPREEQRDIDDARWTDL